MFEITSVHIWLMIAYAVGTWYGIRYAKGKYLHKTNRIVELTIDRLVADGYVKSRKTKKGEVELLKYNEDI